MTILTTDGLTTTRMVQDGEKTVVHTASDVSAVMEWNNAARNARSGFNAGDDHTLVARIPMELVAQFAQEIGVDISAIAQDDGLLAQLLAKYPACKTLDKQVF